MRFRRYYDTFEESVATIVEVNDKADLAEYLQIPEKRISINIFSKRVDWRIGWAQTYVVVVRNEGVVGYCDGPG